MSQEDETRRIYRAQRQAELAQQREQSRILLDQRRQRLLDNMNKNKNK